MSRKIRSKNRKSKKSRFTEVEKTAYLMGQVERGLQNPDSRITESFEKGKKEREKRQRKPLF